MRNCFLSDVACATENELPLSFLSIAYGARRKVMSYGSLISFVAALLVGMGCGQKLPSGAKLVEGVVLLDTMATSQHNRSVHALRDECGEETTTPGQPTIECVQLVNVSGSMFILDDDWGSANESGTFPFSNSIYLTPGQASTLVNAQNCVDEEVRVELAVNVARGANGREVSVSGNVKLFEGTSCSTSELEGETNFAFVVPEDASVPNYSVHVTNGEDYGDIRLTVSNYTRCTARPVP